LNQWIEAALPGLLGSGAVGAGQQLVVGLLLVVILLVRPDGVVGAIASLYAFIARVLHTRRAALPEQTVDGATSDTVGSTDMAALRRADDEAPGVRQPGAVVLSAQGLSKRFGGVKAVNEVSLALHAG